MRTLIAGFAVGVGLVAVGVSLRPAERCFTFVGAAGPRPVLLNQCTGVVMVGEAPNVPPALPPSTTTTTLPRTEV